LTVSSPVLVGVAGRYASALFDLADEGGELDTVATDLGVVREALADSEDLARTVRSPLFRREDQVNAIVGVAGVIGLSELVTRFLGTMASNRRLRLLNDAIRAFTQLLDARRGITRVQVRSARPLSDGQKEALRARIAHAIGGQVELEDTVDASLIGGIAVHIGSRLIDASIRSRLDRMYAAMQGDTPK